MVTIEKIIEASNRVKPYVKRTQVLRVEELDEHLHCKVYVKPECFQVTGSFKARGAINKILSLTDEEKKKGIIAASSGNHAQGVAYAASLFQIPAVIVMPTNALEVKVSGTKKYCPEIVLWGTSSAERYGKTMELIEKYGYTLIHSFNDEDLIAGQGTVGLEIYEDVKDLDAVVCPIGGGGLISGVSTALKGLNKKIKVIGAEPENVPRYTTSLKNGCVTEVKSNKTIADGLRSVKTGAYNFEIVKKNVDEVLTVSEANIKKAFNLLIKKGHILTEPSGATSIGAFLEERVSITKDMKVCFVLSGGNVDNRLIKEILE